MSRSEISNMFFFVFLAVALLAVVLGPCGFKVI